MNAAKAVLEARDLVKEYDRGQVRALAGVDLEVERGEFLCVVGPSGCGKSTLLHMMGALDRPDRGSILLEGRDLALEKRLDQIRANLIGFIFQLHNLMPALTARENVELPLVPLGLRRRERRRRAVAMLEAVGLAARLDHRPNQLSGGQRQRVAVARALVNEPKIVLADEPTGDLDAESGRGITALLQDLRRERELSIVLVTHNPAVASLGDRIVEMEDGRIRE